MQSFQLMTVSTTSRGRYGSGGRSFSGDDGGLTSPSSLPRGTSITSRDSSNNAMEGCASVVPPGKSFFKSLYINVFDHKYVQFL